MLPLIKDDQFKELAGELNAMVRTLEGKLASARGALEAGNTQAALDNMRYFRTGPEQ